MKLHALRYFSVLAEELHFGRAAERLAITQPPLSSAIKSLEEDLGVRLFVRDSKHVELTPAGAAFLVDVQAILARVARSKQTVLAVANGRRGRLDIGITGSLFYREAKAVIAAFGAQVPDIELNLRETSSSAQVEMLLHGELHAGFFNASAAPPQLRWLPLKPDPFVACLPQRHPLARRASLRIAELVGESFVMFDRDVAPANYDNVIAIFSRAGIHPRTCHAARQWLTIIAMIANGSGVSLVPRSLVESGVRGIAFVPLRDEDATSPALLAWNPVHASAARDSFIDCARGVLAASEVRA